MSDEKTNSFSEPYDIVILLIGMGCAASVKREAKSMQVFLQKMLSKIKHFNIYLVSLLTVVPTDFFTKNP